MTQPCSIIRTFACAMQLVARENDMPPLQRKRPPTIENQTGTISEPIEGQAEARAEGERLQP